jgi:hypothetical protein
MAYSNVVMLRMERWRIIAHHPADFTPFSWVALSFAGDQTALLPQSISTGDEQDSNLRTTTISIPLQECNPYLN